jgi:chitinase
MDKICRTPKLHSATLGYVFVFVVFCCAPWLRAAGAIDRPTAVIAYVFPQDRVIDPSEVDGRKVTRINYAFASVKDGEVVPGFSHDAENLAVLTSLKRKNPALTVVISVGGWTWSGAFSDAALTRQSRRRFVESAVRFVERYGLDGVDIDWEYPGMVGNGNKFRPEDKQNYTLLLADLRARFDVEGRRLGRHLVVSIATGASTHFLENTEMEKVAPYVDTVNVMTYDYYMPGIDKVTGHDAPLLASEDDPKHVSAQRSVEEYLRAGVPAKKIVLGVPFYARSWSEVSGGEHGLFQAGKPARGLHVSLGDVQGLLANGYVRYWDANAAVPYLYNEQTGTFISYEDKESIAKKCTYVIEQGLGGVMFWEYFSDPSGVLLDAVNAGLGHSTIRSATGN